MQQQYKGTFNFNSREAYKALFKAPRVEGANNQALAGKPVVTYAIINTRTGWAYVGSTKDFYQRWGTHLSSLERQRHTNDMLQAAFNRDGHHFVITIVEHFTYSIDGNVLLHKEEMAAVPYGERVYNYKVGNDWVNGYSPRTSNGIKSGGYKPQRRRRKNSVSRWYDGTGASRRAAQ